MTSTTAAITTLMTTVLQFCWLPWTPHCSRLHLLLLPTAVPVPTHNTVTKAMDTAPTPMTLLGPAPLLLLQAQATPAPLLVRAIKAVVVERNVNTTVCRLQMQVQVQVQVQGSIPPLRPHKPKWALLAAAGGVLLALLLLVQTKTSRHCCCPIVGRRSRRRVCTHLLHPAQAHTGADSVQVQVSTEHPRTPRRVVSQCVPRSSRPKSTPPGLSLPDWRP